MKILDQVRQRNGFLLVGYVVMPEHVHLLLSEPPKGSVSTVLQVLKQRVSRELRRRKRRNPPGQFTLPFPQPVTAFPHFWQRRFYDFNVWSWGKRKEKLEYMHANPVKRGLVRNPQHWPWSSSAAYSGKGALLLPIDFQE